HNPESSGARYTAMADRVLSN
ncbi:hypothetical protein ACMTAU_09405, partial [Alcaligenes pakistanensis]